MAGNGGIIGPCNVISSGGDKVTQVKSTSTFTTQPGTTKVDVLVVGGGGGGGASGGGGGAGGYLSSCNATVTGGTGYPITVGGGGAAGVAADVYLAKTVSVPADATLVLVDTPIYLRETDILKGGASVASDLDLFISYEVLDDA